jgi:phosphatidylglycerophosphatase A
MNEDNFPRTPSERTLGQRCLLLVGSIGPLGYCPASGTVTVALVGVPAVWLAGRYGVPLWVYVTATALLTGVSVYVHQVGDRILAEKDSRRLVLDELVGYAIAMTAVSPTWQLLILSFLMERAIDVAKVWPADWVEKHGPGGWGVVGDDVIAGLYTLVILHLVAAWVPQYVAPGGGW